MKYEDFSKILEAYRKGQDMLHELYQLGFDFAEGKFQLVDVLHDILFDSLGAWYTEDGVGWVSWFIYETNWQQNENYEAYDDERNLIAQDLRGLWELLEQDYKKESI